MKPISRAQLEAVSQLDETGRFQYFVKRVVDQEAAWGLWEDGWALMGDSDGERHFPLWSAPEFASQCREGALAKYAPEEISLESLIDELLPQLTADRVACAVFPVPGGATATVSADDLAKALRLEAERYE